MRSTGGCVPRYDRDVDDRRGEEGKSDDLSQRDGIRAGGAHAM